LDKNYIRARGSSILFIGSSVSTSLGIR
jgi:hypothetical protein